MKLREEMRLIGTVGTDWIRKQGYPFEISDDLLRSWRDHLEEQLVAQLSIQADLGIGTETRFKFFGKSETHTITEIESFARRDLDLFLHKEIKRKRT